MTIFEIKDRDLAGRICKLRTEHGVIETPTIFPVINPNRTIIEPKDMKKYGAEALITNAYILLKGHKEEVLEKGLHKFLGFDGPIMTDSGAYQSLIYGEVDITNKDVIEFQKNIEGDIGVILDVPGLGDHDKVKESVDRTIKRAKEAQTFIKDSKILWCGPIQGNVHSDLLKKCAREMGKMDFQIHPIGSVVPLLKDYKFAPHIEMIKIVKENVPENRPLHLFGAGHPMFFAFAVAMGIDFFDSAAYALYAKKERYLTQTGTYRLKDLKYLPCSCPICSNANIADFDEKALAEHNLYVTFEEMRLIKQHIKEKTLFELLEMKAKAHPHLNEAMKALVKQKKFIEKYDPITKKHFFYLSDFSKHRSEILRTKEMTKNIPGEKIKIKPFGEVPVPVLDCYPFSQTISDEELKKPKVTDLEKIKAASTYWFGVNIFDDVKIQKSRKTGRVRQVKDKEGKLLASFRASDNMILLHKGAKKLFEKSKEHRVTVMDDKEIHDLIKQGKTLFAPHVKKADKNIRPFQQVLIVNSKGELLAAGEALLNQKEMLDFDHGMAVNTKNLG